MSRADNEEYALYADDSSNQTSIQNRYCFWYHKRGGGAKAGVNYEESMKKIASFQTIEHFWQIYDHLLRPNDFKTTTDYHLFKNGIKPTWEDPQNERGGKWMIRLKKGLSSAFWEEVVLAIIGEQFDVGHEICGAVVSIRHGEDIISVWNKNAENTEAKNKIRDQLRRILRLPAFIAIEYKKHQDSIVDKSSFRNTSVWRSPAAIARENAGAANNWGDQAPKIANGEKSEITREANTNFKSEGFHRQDRDYSSPRGASAGGRGNSNWKAKTTYAPAPPMATGDPTKDRENRLKYEANISSSTGSRTTPGGTTSWRSPRGDGENAWRSSPRDTDADKEEEGSSTRLHQEHVWGQERR